MIATADRRLRLVFMATAEFAVPSLEALAQSRHALVRVYTQPARPAGRGLRARASAVEIAARRLDLPVASPASLRDSEVQAEFRALDADLAVVAAYGLILPRPILAAPRLGAINLHASLLPRWRGAAPIQRALLAGDARPGSRSSRSSRRSTPARSWRWRRSRSPPRAPPRACMISWPGSPRAWSCRRPTGWRPSDLRRAAAAERRA